MTLSQSEYEGLQGRRDGNWWGDVVCFHSTTSVRVCLAIYVLAFRMLSGHWREHLQTRHQDLPQMIFVTYEFRLFKLHARMFELEQSSSDIFKPYETKDPIPVHSNASDPSNNTIDATSYKFGPIYM
jgi:hypothetical protein